MKQGHGLERAPQNADWYYYRCAAVLRRIYNRPGTGYGGLSKAFATLKNNGSRPEKTVKASRGLLHWACRSLEGLKLIQKGKKSGRTVTKEGRRKCDAIAFNVKSGRKAVGAAAGKKTVKK
jgi:small subunit ribosomal protein S19e